MLFRESERLDLRLWLKHTIRNRGATPTASAAVVCGLMILVAQFFVGLLISMPQQMEFSDVAWLVCISMATVVIPTALMTGFFTRSPAKTLLIRWPGWLVIVAGDIPGVAVHPLAMVMNSAASATLSAREKRRSIWKHFRVLIHKAPIWWLPPLIMGLLAGNLRRVDVSRFYPLGLATYGPQMAGDFAQRLVLRRHASIAATIDLGIHPRHRAGVRCRANGQYLARAVDPLDPQFVALAAFDLSKEFG